MNTNKQTNKQVYENLKFIKQIKNPRKVFQ